MISKKTVSRYLSIAIIIIVSLSAHSLPTSADAAPPEPPPGQNLLPGEENTMVQMVAEEVIIEVNGPGEMDTVYGEDDIWVILGHKVSVTATFWMQNQGEEEEQMAVRFPISSNDGWGREATVEDFTVTVDGVKMDWWTTLVPDPTIYTYILAWAHFDVTFPAGEEVILKVTYTTLSTDNWQTNESRLRYILETGAGWYGPIGEGKITLRLPYQANLTNVVLEFATPGAVFIGNEVIWRFKDLEPTNADNWSAEILYPELWETILDSQETLRRDPDNFGALVKLGEAVLLSTMQQKGWEIKASPEFFQLFMTGEEAYARAVDLRPDDLDVRAAYVEFQILHAYLARRAINWEQISYVRDFPSPTFEEIMDHLDEIFSIDPENERALELMDMYDWALDHLASPPPTPKPTFMETPKPTSTPLPSATPTLTKTPTTVPSATPYPTYTPFPSPEPLQEEMPTPEDNRSDGSIFAGILIGFVLALFIMSRKK